MTRLALLLALCACAPPSPGSIRVSVAEGSTDLQPAADAASERILAASGLDVLGGEHAVSVRLAPTSALAPSPDRMPANCGSDCTWSGHFDGREVLVNDSPRLAEGRARVVLHETFCHALTLTSGVHLPAGGAGLCAEANGLDCITEADLELACARVVCKAFVPEVCK